MLITFFMWKYFDTAAVSFFDFLNKFYHATGSELHLLSVYKSFSIDVQVFYSWTLKAF